MSTMLDINRRSATVERLEFVMEECCNCGVPFMISRQMQKRLVATHESFYCPNGHGQSYTGPSDAEKLKKQLEEERQRSAREQQELQDKFLDEVGRRQKLERKLKRVDKGVCPCCNRTFSNLARHMQTKHKEETTTKT